MFASNIIGNAAYVFMARARESDDIASEEVAAIREAGAADLGAGVSFGTCEIG